MVDIGERAALPRRSSWASMAAPMQPGATAGPLSPRWLDRYERFAGLAAHGAAQHPVWLRAWAREACPDIVAVTLEEDGAPVLMLALEVVRERGSTVARFVGGSHANANFPALDPRWAAGAGDDAIRAIVRAVRRARPDIDLLHLERMLAEEGGAPNPLLAAGAAPSPNLAFAASLDGGFDAVLMRTGERRKAKKHRAQRRKFEAAGGLRRIEARSANEVDHLLSAFFLFKEQRFRKVGIADVFAAPDIRAAFRALFKDALKQPHPPFLLSGLEVGGVVRAVTGDSVQAHRTTCEFGGIGEDELAKYSPGGFLFHLNIRAACEEGKRFFDFGVGDEPYKRHWCDIETTHFDAVLPLSLKGRTLAALLAASRRLKTVVKRSPLIWRLAKRLRRQVGGRPEAEVSEENP